MFSKQWCNNRLVKLFCFTFVHFRLLYPKWKRKWWMVFTALVTCIFIFGVICVVTSLLSMMSLFIDKFGKKIGTSIGGVFIAAQIKILDLFWTYIAPKLVDKENPRSETQYINALIIKLVAFKFVNSFYAFVYVAFFQNHTDRKCPAGPTLEHDCIDLMEHMLYKLGECFYVLGFLKNVVLEANCCGIVMGFSNSGIKSVCKKKKSYQKIFSHPQVLHSFICGADSGRAQTTFYFCEDGSGRGGGVEVKDGAGGVVAGEKLYFLKIEICTTKLNIPSRSFQNSI